MVWTSLFGIITIVLLARALGFAAAPTLADPAEARRIAADALHDFRAVDAELAADGRGALVTGADGRIALVRPFGDRWVVRIVNGAAASVAGDRLRIAPAEAMFPPAELRLGPASAARWAQRL
jgi:hypothetical protein